MLKWINIGLIIFLGTHMDSLAQCPEPPLEFLLDIPADYKETENLCFELMECMLQNPQEYSLKQTESATAFCLIWLGGAPDLIVHVHTERALFLEDNPEYLYTYIFALALVERDLKSYSQEEKEAEALSLLASYELLLNLKKRNKELKKIEKLYNRGKLVAYLKSIS